MGLGKKDLDRLETAIGLAQTPDAARAADILKKILRKHPANALAVHFLGIAEACQGHHDIAVAQLKKSLSLDPHNQNFKQNYATYLMNSSRHHDALPFFRTCMEQEPQNLMWIYGYASSLFQLGSYGEALACFERALGIDPNFFDALNERGAALGALHRYQEGLESCERAIALNPRSAAAYNNLGLNLQGLRRHQEALAAYEKAVSIDPNHHHAYHNRGNALVELQQYDEALAAYGQALAIKLDFESAHVGRGTALREQERYDEALAAYEQAVAINPGLNEAEGIRIHTKMYVCEWKNLKRECSRIISLVQEGILASEPFYFLAFSSSPADQLKCAKLHVALESPPSPKALWKGERYRHDRIRIAYLSADFHDHSSAYLIAELFELHDRERFEITGVSYGPDDNSEMRTRLIRSFDRFLDVRFKADEDVARLLREIEIEIAVELKGHTGGSRLEILAHRPAPVQVSYLGYQGTTGAEFIDYVIGDEIALPSGLQPFFTEKIVHLPVSHQVNDSTRKIPSLSLSRSQVGLPENGFVFCTFNDSNKVTPAFFDIWMRLLGTVDGSVLWLVAESNLSRANLCREAEARGIDPARLVFAKKVGLGEHLFRHRLANLYLDTLPVCAHTSASRTLWAGLPILTCTGSAFAGRITASMLHAIGLPELVTHSLKEYEALAVKLATDPPLLEGIRRKLEENRRTSSLFDTDRFRRHLEKAYTIMWERSQRGEPHSGFAVDPSD